MLNVYYMPVWFQTYTGVFPEELRKQEPFHLQSEEEIRLYKFLDVKNKREKFADGYARLLIEPANGKPEYLMDAYGNVRRNGRDEYQMSPRAFLNVVTSLDALTVKRMEAMRTKPK